MLVSPRFGLALPALKSIQVAARGNSSLRSTAVAPQRDKPREVRSDRTDRATLAVRRGNIASTLARPTAVPPRRDKPREVRSDRTDRATLAVLPGSLPPALKSIQVAARGIGSLRSTDAFPTTDRSLPERFATTGADPIYKFCGKKSTFFMLVRNFGQLRGTTPELSISDIRPSTNGGSIHKFC